MAILTREVKWQDDVDHDHYVSGNIRDFPQGHVTVSKKKSHN
jgi:hypothetical protein